MCEDITTADMLEMKLHDISDLLLQEMCKQGSRSIKVDLPGSDGEGNRMMLTLYLREVE